MVAVIFEVKPKTASKEEYLKVAGQLKSQLIQMDGFISVERFTSLQDPDKLLSLSFWEDEESICRWRNLLSHRQAQKKGRDIIFENYRLRVANVLRDYGMFDRAQVPDDSREIYD